MRIALMLVLVVGMAEASEQTTLICRGSHWSYKFTIDDSKCSHEQKTHKKIPGAYDKGHVNKIEGKDGLTPTECWKSAALVQADGAKCCVEKGMESDCKKKGVQY